MKVDAEYIAELAVEQGLELVPGQYHGAGDAPCQACGVGVLGLDRGLHRDGYGIDCEDYEYRNAVAEELECHVHFLIGIEQGFDDEDELPCMALDREEFDRGYDVGVRLRGMRAQVNDRVRVLRGDESSESEWAPRAGDH
jgi:hypothetical protein